LKPYYEAGSPVRELAELLAAEGHEVYLVGGTVRDAFLDLDLEHRDIDLATSARPDVVEPLVTSWADAVWTQGRAFGTIGAIKASRHFEITPYRADVYPPESRKPEVQFSRDIETDLSRRDFTVNAMALALPEPAFVDPFHGAADLAALVLRTPLAPEV